MIKNANEFLQILYDSFLEESLELRLKQQNNLLKIKELDVILDLSSNEELFQENQESDFYMFSPRKDSFNKKFFDNKDSKDNEIEESKKKKDDLEAENEKLYNELDKLEKKIINLQKIISGNSLLDGLVFLDIQEKERQRIARDLHDSSLQNLTHLIHSLELSSLFIDQDPTRAKLELAMAGKKIRAVIEDIRNTIYGLRPMEFDDLGFRDTIQSMLNKLQKETNIRINFEMEYDISIKNELIFSNIYEIIKECVTNSIKHSEAKEIKITVFEKDNVCHTEIVDNGKGFDDFSIREKKKHFGLQILDERIQLLEGSLDIQSSGSKDVGTKISIKIPIIG